MAFERNELIRLLRHNTVKMGRLSCFGCGHEHNCGIHGCAILREAAAMLAVDATLMECKDQEITKLRYAVEQQAEELETIQQAKRDGRLVVLPCKVGDTVYEPNKRGFISTYKVVSIHLSTCSILIGWDLIDGIYSNVNGFEASAIGKTVFLTREEAEAALAGKGGEG